MTSSPWDFLTGVAANDRRNVALVLESVQDLYAPSELEELMRHAVDRALLVTDAQRGLLLLEGPTGELEISLARDKEGCELPRDVPYSRSVVTSVHKSGASRSAFATKHEDMTKSMHQIDVLSVMAVPLVVKGRSLGVLYVDSTKTVKTFGASELAVFRALGGLVAQAVENARQERIERELTTARIVQQQLFPRNLPQHPGFDLAAVVRPCEEVSGDYCDAIELQDGTLALIVGDVSGHGLGPALLMASTRASLHSSLQQTEPDPVQVIESVNRFLERDTSPEMYMSLFLGILDPEAGSVSYVNAGHCPPLIRRADGGVESLRRTGMVLGVDKTKRYELAGPVVLQSGDVLLSHTDGLYEARDHAEDMYGEERLHASLCRHVGDSQSAQDALNGILDDVRTFVGRQPLADDVTLMVLRAT